MNDAQSAENYSQDPVWSISAVLKSAVSFLQKNYPNPEFQNFKLDVELILAFAIGCRRIDLFLALEKPLQKHEREHFKTLLVRRARGEPVAYILNYKEFYGLKFKVNADTLIPRPDTEVLIESVLKVAVKESPLDILDIGTGSGCIGLVLAKNLPRATIHACDISPKALQVAEENKTLLNIQNARFFETDCSDLTVFAKTLAGQKFDFIVSNPPYISRDQKNSLMQSVRAFEPELALFPQSSDALYFYRIFSESLKDFLHPKGWIFLEIGFDQAPGVTKIFENAGWLNFQIFKDLSGCDRVMTAQLH